MPDLQGLQINAIAAGWDPADGSAPYRHGAEPSDAIVEMIAVPHVKRHLIVPEPLPLDGMAPGTVSWPSVLTEMQSVVGFVEGPANQNPWGPEQGVANAAYCCSFACMVPYHHGYRWPGNSQFGAKGDAYVPFRRQHAIEQGEWMEDHASQGRPADVQPGDQLIYVWPGGDGAGDHIETAIAVSASGNTSNIGANTGRPEGVHSMVRSRHYLLGRIRPHGYAPASLQVGDGNPFTPLVVNSQFDAPTKRALQWRLNLDGAQPPLLIDGDFGVLSIKMLQSRLNAVAGPVAIDGEIGLQTTRALQRHVGVGVDGEWGPLTNAGLQRSLNAALF
jgi:hypothetical protein